MPLLISRIARSAPDASRSSTMRGDPAVGVAHDAAVAVRIVELGGEHGRGRARLAVLLEQPAQRAGLEQRHVGVEQQHGAGLARPAPARPAAARGPCRAAATARRTRASGAIRRARRARRRRRGRRRARSMSASSRSTVRSTCSMSGRPPAGAAPSAGRTSSACPCRPRASRRGEPSLRFYRSGATAAGAAAPREPAS